MVSLADLPNALAPLPPAVLRLDGDTVAALHHLGVDTVERLTALPREALPARFGPQLTLRLDQALGRVAEPLVPLSHHRPVEARMEFGGVVESLETLWFAFKQLVNDVVKDLARRGCGARRMEAVFHRDGAPPLAKTINLSRASRSRANLFDLLRCATEHLEDGGGERRQSGFTGVRLRVPVFERLTEAQTRLHDDEEAAGRAELDHLLERLVARLGDRAVARPQLVESHLPERAWTGASASEFRVQSSEFKKGRSEVRGQRSGLAKESSSLNSELQTLTSRLPRPLHLLPTPVEVRVMAEPSGGDDRNSRPRQLTRGRQVHRLTHVTGPERIAGEWWRGHLKTRDYYDVEDESGRRFWLFRVVTGEAARWFVHGEFE